MKFEVIVRKTGYNYANYPQYNDSSKIIEAAGCTIDNGRLKFFRTKELYLKNHSFVDFSPGYWMSVEEIVPDVQDVIHVPESISRIQDVIGSKE